MPTMPNIQAINMFKRINIMHKKNITFIIRNCNMVKLILYLYSSIWIGGILLLYLKNIMYENKLTV